MDFQTFRNPPNEYRIAPWWAWNDDLRNDELLRQIRAMEQAGWGGFFMHARTGRVTPYLSKAWMDRIKTAVREARKRSMLPWLYDEDKWPSGFAGGKIPARGSAMRTKALILSREPMAGKNFKLMHVYEVDNPDAPRKVRVIPAARSGGPADTPGHTTLFLYSWTDVPGDAWFNGQCYADLINPRAVKAFIEVTHEAYREALGDELWKSIPGIFTDEPAIFSFNFFCCQGPERIPCVPWTDGLARFFTAARGYDIRPHLLSLFCDCGDYGRIRYDFYRTAGELFTQSYTKAIFDWCSKHQIRSVGHFVEEQTFFNQVAFLGGGVMQHYEWMHVPGIDHLSRNIDKPIEPKQLASVADQLGKPRRLTEIFGGGGQEMTLEDFKWEADWHLVHGVNFIVPHIALYSLRGCRKRDFPPTISWHQPYWDDMPALSDHLARLSYVTSQGSRVSDILVLHTIESFWMGLNRTRTKYIDYAADHHEGPVWDGLRKVVDDLLAMHRDYDLGDEGIMARHGSVSKDCLVVGKKSYAVVIVPPARTLRRTTVRLLEQFQKSGGKLIFLEQVPDCIDARPDRAGRIRKLSLKARPIRNNCNGLRKALDEILPADVEVTGKGSKKVLYHHRLIDGRHFYLLLNTDFDNDAQCALTLAQVGRLTRWDTLTGEEKPLACRTIGDHTQLKLTLPGGSSALLCLDPELEPLRVEADESDSPSRRIPLDGPWDVVACDDNALTLDFCELKVGRGKYGPREYVLSAARKVRTPGQPFAARYSFKVDRVPSGSVSLVVEVPDNYRVRVNGRSVSFKQGLTWLDPSFGKADVTSLLKPGTNEVTVSGTGDPKLELESIYLVGSFAVRNRSNRSFALTALPRRVKANDLVAQGFPFFAGRLTCRCSVNVEKVNKRVILAFDRTAFHAAHVKVNGIEAGRILWKPYSLDVTRFVRPGVNTVEITVANSLRNLLGPHHGNFDKFGLMGPNQFEPEEMTTTDYLFVELGLETAHLHAR